MSARRPRSRRSAGYGRILLGAVTGDRRPRPVLLSALDADVLLNALEAYAEEQRRATAPGAEAAPEDAREAEADRENLAHIHELRGRIARAWEDTP